MWVVSREAVPAVIVVAAAGPALGVAFERSMDGRSLTPRERRLALLLVGTGVAVGLLVLGTVLLLV
ncbi:hypothetical protein ACFO0N_10075 [Halobium salinum]|uniref:Uncharacterized protein n=1 Tax=Halobium salinum TaxID=1364940 RepID=A0ABD5PBL4_9EURY|nr:hypothetical protein [Halobium salinum]